MICRPPQRRTPGALALALALAMALALGTAAADAAPRRPPSDSTVLERVAARSGDPRTRELEALRRAWQADPHNAEVAVRMARRWFDEGLARGDPRYVGHAQAALGPWWSTPSPPLAVRVQRARVLQYGHRFDEALADLDAVLAADTGDAEAWATAAAIRMVRADYDGARRACQAVAPLTTTLLATGCTAYADAMSGRADEAARALTGALAAAPAGASSAERLWSLTRLAEIEELRGADASAEAAYRAALSLGEPDVYLLAAYADFLLERGRAAEVLALLNTGPGHVRDAARADVLLLRMALAAKASGDARGASWGRELAARFDAARARGDATHEKEASRFALALQGDVGRALALARSNFAVQREVADARALFEAALATRDAAAAKPALEWLRYNGVQHPGLRKLASQVEAMR